MQANYHSFIESVTNAVVGYGTSLAAQLLIFPCYNIHVNIQTSVCIGIWFTIISIIRSYIMRRVFNKLTGDSEKGGGIKNNDKKYKM